LQLLAKMRYDAEHVLWNPIARRTDRDGLLSARLLGRQISSLRYSDGTPVLRDRTLNGAEIMRDIVVELGKQDEVAFEELKYDRWSEENQRSEENNPYIYKAVMDAFRRRVPSVGPYEIPAINRLTGKTARWMLSRLVRSGTENRAQTVSNSQSSREVEIDSRRDSKVIAGCVRWPGQQAATR